MNGGIFCGFLILFKLEPSTGGVDLVMEVAPFFHAQKGYIVGAAVFAVLGARQLLALGFEMAPHI